MRIRVVVDRVEGKMAVLLAGQAERRIDFPLDFLPPVHEGAVLWLTWEMDQPDEADRRDRAGVLLKRLLQRDVQSE